MKHVSQLKEADIFVLDGLTAVAKDSLISLTLKWRSERAERRALVVSSFQVYFHQEGLDTIHTIFVPSWKFQDYELAISNDDFYDAVKSKFPIDIPDKQEALAEKYFYAGGSARWMFYCPIDLLISLGKSLVARAPDLNNLIQGIQGPQSSAAVNQLVSQYAVDDSFIVSQYIAREISNLCDSSFIKAAAVNPLALSNPTFAGWIFEADFLLQLRLALTSRQSLTYSYAKEGGQSEASWNVTNQIHFLDPPEFADIVRQRNLTWEDGTWFIPKRWNQGCYDAFCLAGDLKVIFVQVTCAKSHSVAQNYLKVALENLETSFKVTVKSARLVVVRPKDLSADFALSNITGSLGKFASLFRSVDGEGNTFFQYDLVSISRS
jgi:hypothetical protein